MFCSAFINNNTGSYDRKCPICVMQGFDDGACFCIADVHSLLFTKLLHFRQTMLMVKSSQLFLSTSLPSSPHDCDYDYDHHNNNYNDNIFIDIGP